MDLFAFALVLVGCLVAVFGARMTAEADEMDGCFGLIVSALGTALVIVGIVLYTKHHVTLIYRP